MSKTAKQAGSGGRVNDPAILLLSEIRPCGSSAFVSSFDVYSIDQIPVRVFHVLEADVSKDASIVEEDVNATEGVNGGLDDLLAILDTVVVGNSLAACSSDLVDYNICSLEITSEILNLQILQACEKNQP